MFAGNPKGEGFQFMCGVKKSSMRLTQTSLLVATQNVKESLITELIRELCVYQERAFAPYWSGKFCATAPTRLFRNMAQVFGNVVGNTKASCVTDIKPLSRKAQTSLFHAYPFFAMSYDQMVNQLNAIQFKCEFCYCVFIHRKCESGCPKNIVQSLIVELLIQIRADLAFP